VQFLHELARGMSLEKSEIRSLDYPTVFYLEGAEGWVILGDLDEAIRELDRIAPEDRTHPEVLLLRWELSVKTENWDTCMAIGLALTIRYPHNPCGWIVLAQTLYYTNRIVQAYQIAIRRVEAFPDSAHLIYDAACYACLLRKREEAQRLLKMAMLVGDAERIRLRALEDPDLELLRTGVVPSNGLPGK